MSNNTQIDNYTEEHKSNASHRLAWTLIFIVIVLLSIVAVTSFNKNFSFRSFFKTLSESSPAWIAASVISMLCYILCEALALMYICRSFGYGRKLDRGLQYASTGIYFSAITPSATGGQPATAYVMIKDGIPGVFATVALLVNLLLYTLSIAILGALAFLLRPSLFLKFSVVSRIFIIIGTTAQTALTVFVLLLLRNKTILHTIGACIIRILKKLHLIRNDQKWLSVFEEKMAEYDRYSEYLRGKKKMMLKALAINLVERISIIAVTMFTYLAIGAEGSNPFDILIMQIYVILGSTFMPIPGSVGITDYLMIDGYSSLIAPSAAGTLELLSRTLSFYSCVFVCGIFIICEYFKGRKSDDRNI